MMGDAVEEEVVWLELPQESCDVSVRILPFAGEGVVVVHAPSRLLIKIPYFATSLSQPWQASQGSSHREITLHCSSAATCPTDFRCCLQFLKPEENAFKWQLNAVLKLLRPADYLHFQECTDLCMQYLAAVRWSDADEDAVHQAFTNTGIKPSADLYARLEPLQNVKEFFKEALLVHAEYACTSICEEQGRRVENSYPFSCFVDFLKEAASKAPPQISQSALTEMWISMTDDTIKGEALTTSRMNMWSVMTNAILMQGDKGAILKALIERFPQFCTAVLRTSLTYHPKVVLITFERSMATLIRELIPCEKPIVMLSNAERALLSITLIPMLDIFNNYSLNAAFKSIVCTLPLQDPIMRKLMKEHPSKFYLDSETGAFWRSKLFLALNRFNMEDADTSPTTLP